MDLDVHLVYGDGRDKESLFDAAREKELCTIFRIIQKRIIPIFGNGEKQTSFCCIQDLVRAIVFAAFSEKAVGKIYYITDGNSYSYREVLDIVARDYSNP